MIAYEFLAHDMEGMTLLGVTDGGTCIWDGSEEQEANAIMQCSYFAEHGEFYRGGFYQDDNS